MKFNTVLSFFRGEKAKNLYTVVINRTNRYAAWIACKDVDLRSNSLRGDM